MSGFFLFAGKQEIHFNLYPNIYIFAALPPSLTAYAKAMDASATASASAHGGASFGGLEAG
jgi:hypothetical protein